MTIARRPRLLLAPLLLMAAAAPSSVAFAATPGPGAKARCVCVTRSSLDCWLLTFLAPPNRAYHTYF